jgi:hypothetical protein
VSVLFPPAHLLYIILQLTEKSTASGIWFLIAYQTYFFIQGGVTKGFEYSIMTTCLGFLGVNIGMYAMRHLIGRRTILIIGAMACGLAQLGAGIAYSTSGPGTTVTTNCLVAFITLHKFFYNGCVGAASYPVATEVVSTRLRAWTVGTATGLGYVLAWLTSFCSPYFINPAELNWYVHFLAGLQVTDTDQIKQQGRPVLLHLGGIELRVRGVLLPVYARDEGSFAGGAR